MAPAEVPTRPAHLLPPPARKVVPPAAARTLVWQLKDNGGTLWGHPDRARLEGFVAGRNATRFKTGPAHKVFPAPAPGYGYPVPR
jgi:hypothetical protein